MALKMKENFQKTTQANQNFRTGTASNVYINRLGRPMPLSVPIPLSKDTSKGGLSNDAEDSESHYGKTYFIFRKDIFGILSRF